MPKPSNKELQDIGVYQWADIRSDYVNSDLFLGNGFSIRISNMLSYSSLFEKFLEELDNGDVDTFNQFGTTNFELILEKIGNAILVNTLFDIQIEPLEASLPKLRNGLIAAINKNHPKHGEIDGNVFSRLSVELDSFEDVYTTNYDTFLYKVIMCTKDRYVAGQKVRRYQDYFWLTQGDYLKFLDTQNSKSLCLHFAP